MKQFEFINVDQSAPNGRPRYNKDVRSKIARAHRRYERQQRQPAKAVKTLQLTRSPHSNAVVGFSASGSSPEVGISHSTACPADERQQSLGILNIQRLLIAEPLFSNEHHELLQIFSKMILHSVVPLGNSDQNPVGQRWLENAIGSPAMALATCSNASITVDQMERRNVSSARTLRLRTQAIAAVNQAFTSNDATTDATIAAVVALVSNGLPTGDVDELRVHHAGLKTLVALRGGPKRLGFDGALLTAISSYAHQAPIVAPSADLLSIDMSCAILTAGLPAFNTVDDEERNFHELLADIRQLVLMQEHVGESRASQAIANRFGGLRAEVEAAILVKRYNAITVSAHSVVASCNAALILTHNVLRRYSSRRPILRGLLAQLQHSLMAYLSPSATHVYSIEPEELDLLTWASCVGWSVRSDEVQKTFFHIALQQMILGPSKKGRQDLETKLYGYVWTPKLPIPYLTSA